MRILMLGWEFPPYIAGGLGTACYGLTKALDRQGHQIVFVLPKAVNRSHASHIRLLSPEAVVSAGSVAGGGGERSMATGSSAAFSPSDEFAMREGRSAAALGESAGFGGYGIAGLEHVEFHGVPAVFSHTYPTFRSSSSRWFDIGDAGGGGSGGGGGEWSGAGAIEEALEAASLAAAGVTREPRLSGRAPSGGEVAGGMGGGSGAGVGYEGDMVENSERYARLVVALARREKFDVIHAHDWMTFPAGQAAARLTGKPLVVHVHSTEFDRAGEHVNQRVYDIERRGMHAALRVIAVSHLTASICARRYGVDRSKIDVVWNGIESEAVQPQPGLDSIGAKDKIVLFLGRITMQKGPEYFIRAAKRVLEKVPHAKFVVAGSGDMATRMIEEAAALGIGQRVTFTGFLRGRDVERVYRMADCYVMPSVSEPFGIAPLEAMRHDVPVIISKQSGVSEVLTHALKVDFWDIEEMANKIVAVLRHAPLGATLREHGAFELRKLTWDGAAVKCVQAYEKAVRAMGR
ncbi:MAG: glycosyltransferase [Phycisphaerales bacterium]